MLLLYIHWNIFIWCSILITKGDIPWNSFSERFKSVLEDIEYSPCNSEEEGEINDDESEQDFEREAYYNSENGEYSLANSNEEVSLEGDYTYALENLQEDTMLLSVLKDTNQYPI